MTELSTPEAVRAHYTEPYELAVSKEIGHLDDHCRRFIALSPLLVIASSDAEGRLDATPRGDAPGFVAVPDDRTLLIPDRSGNNRVDTMMNIAAHPRIGLLFFVPGAVETLRVNGRATILANDEALLRPLAANGKLPRAAIRVEVEEVYFQCGKALVRSDLWNPEARIARGTLPPFGQVLADHCKIPSDPALSQAIEDDYRTGLY
jgi:PPOX class probable FMN-dependent enzyme